MAKDMHPPFSKAVVQVADGQVETFTAAGWTEAKRESPKRAERKSGTDK